MITQAELQYLNGADVYAADGGKIGSAGQVFVDDRTGEPEWISVRTGVSDAREFLVPLEGATLADDRLEVPFGKDRVEGAPQVGADGDLGPAGEDELNTYYGLDSGTARLRRYTVTDQPMPAAHTQVRLERQPATGRVIRSATPQGRC